MRLLKTYDDNGAHDGYLDPAKGISHRVHVRKLSVTGGIKATYRVRAYYPCVDGDGDRIADFLSAELDTREEAMTELDRIAALIEGKHGPRWGIGIDLASGPDSAVDVVIDRLTGKIVSVKDAVTSAQGWVAGPPPKDGEWYLVAYEPLDNGARIPGTARWQHSAFFDDGGARYDTTITHHLPTPIQPPQES